MIAAEFEPAGNDGSRRSQRSAVSIAARIGQDGLERSLCRVIDLSMHGARLQIYSALKRGSQIWLILPDMDARVAEIAWSDDFVAGCQFAAPLDQESYDKLIDRDDSLRMID